jgi:hypothetical protein
MGGYGLNISSHAGPRRGVESGNRKYDGRFLSHGFQLRPEGQFQPLPDLPSGRRPYREKYFVFYLATFPLTSYISTAYGVLPRNCMKTFMMKFLPSLQAVGYSLLSK